MADVLPWTSQRSCFRKDCGFLFCALVDYSLSVDLIETDVSYLRRLLLLSSILLVACVGFFCILTALRKVTDMSIFAVIVFSQKSIILIPGGFFIYIDLTFAKSD
jgi:hypothetical protein